MADINIHSALLKTLTFEIKIKRTIPLSVNSSVKHRQYRVNVDVLVIDKPRINPHLQHQF